MKNVYGIYLIFSSILFFSVSLFSMMPKYENIIYDIQEIHGATRYTIVLKCSEAEPIAVYAPATYQESLQDSKIRIFMPNSMLAQGVEPLDGVLEVLASGIEILLFGKLLSKTSSNGLLFITVEVV